MTSALSTRAAQRFRLVSSLLVLGIGNYELWRIHKGIHPYWTPRLEEAGLVRQRNKLAEDGSIKQEALAAEQTAPKAYIKWTNLNGVPIPTLEASVEPTRKN
jgi:ABC-type nickel/cobalt efflux system permease component RcnA